MDVLLERFELKNILTNEMEFFYPAAVVFY